MLLWKEAILKLAAPPVSLAAVIVANALPFYPHHLFYRRMTQKEVADPVMVPTGICHLRIRFLQTATLAEHPGRSAHFTKKQNINRNKPAYIGFATTA